MSRREPWRAFGQLLLSLVLATTSLLSFARVSLAAWPQACTRDGLHNLFVGEYQPSSSLRGVYSEIEFFNEQLCVQGATPDYSWSLSWVSLEGPNSDSIPGVSIYQGGYAKCPPPEVGSCPWNGGASYYWYFFGWEEGPCGDAFNTGMVKAPKGNATAGIHDFQISKVGSNYYYWIDEVVQGSRPAWNLDECWGGTGPRLAEWTNEMLDQGDQNGGTVANHQSFANNQYQDATGWRRLNLPKLNPCRNNAQPSVWACYIATNRNDWFYSWDRRAP